MAGYLKKVFIIGNLGADPVMRFTSDGTPVTSFNVAVNERARRGQGQEGGSGGPAGQGEETTTWFRVSAWRRQGEIAHDLLKKGMSVFVSGDLRTSEFTGKDGEKRTSLEITMQDMQILTPKGVQEGGGFDEGAPTGGQASGTQGSRPSATYGSRQGGGQASGGRQSAEPSYSDEEDIPF